MQSHSLHSETDLSFLFLSHTFSHSCSLCACFPSSFLFGGGGGNGTWLFNLITGDWWHQAQSCADLAPKAGSRGSAGDEEQWDGTDQSVSVKQRSDQRRSHSRWALRSQHVSQIVGGPIIQQVRIHSSLRLVSLLDLNLVCLVTF